MNTVLLEPVELRSKGFEALVNALGWVNAVRYGQQFDRSNLNYAAERTLLLPDWDAAELVRRVAALAPPSTRT